MSLLAPWTAASSLGPCLAKRMECAQLAAAFENQPRPNAPPSGCAL